MGSNGRNRETGGLASDPQAESSIEEPMWKLRLSEAADAYPERPSEVVCKYYMKTGVCGFGASCRFNHPRDNATHSDVVKHGGELHPERAGQPLCKHYMTRNNCKFGSSCKYDHPKHGDGTDISFNYQGYPLRPGEKECSYFVRTGQCKFGATCKFDHPQPVHNYAPAAKLAPRFASNHLPTLHTSVHPSPIPAPQPYGMIPGNWQVLRTPHFLPGPYPYLQGAYGPAILQPGVFPMPSWGPYPIHMSPMVSPGIQSALESGMQYEMSQFSAPAPPYAGAYPLIPSSIGALSVNQKEPLLAGRPDQPECRNYSKSGYCRYGSSCKYRHASQAIAPKTTPARGESDLPLRSGVPYFTDYAHHGVGQFGSSGKFNHWTGAGTLSYSPSTSSLVDGPVAPFPMGCSVGTSGPSSSSSDFQPNVSSGSTKETI